MSKITINFILKFLVKLWDSGCVPVLKVTISIHSVLCISKFKRNQFLSRQCKIKEFQNKTIGFSGYCQFLNWKLSILQCHFAKMIRKMSKSRKYSVTGCL